MADNVLIALKIMGQGMFGIFVVIGLISGFVAIMGKIGSRPKKED